MILSLEYYTIAVDNIILEDIIKFQSTMYELLIRYNQDEEEYYNIQDIKSMLLDKNYRENSNNIKTH